MELQPAPYMTLGKPQAPAALTAEQALAVARAQFAAQLFDHPYTLEYGSFLYPVRTWHEESESWEPGGLRDAWKITITGIHIPTPGGRRPDRNSPIVYMHTYVIFIDDKAGKYLMASGY